MSLPEPWIDRLFAKLTVTYGAAWLRMWEGCDLSAVKADWAEELAGFQQSPESIRYGLNNLPTDKPPTVLQFREACRRAPRDEFAKLPPPSPDPKVAAKVREVFVSGPRKAGPRDWAFALRDREQGGQRLSMFQRNAWRDALRYEPRGEEA